MSVMIACGGLSAAIFGKWTTKVGPPKTRVADPCSFDTDPDPAF
jgi:hypothetical protein